MDKKGQGSLYGKLSFLGFRTGENPKEGFDLLDFVWGVTPGELSNSEVMGVYLDPFSLKVEKVVLKTGEEVMTAGCTLNYSGIAANHTSHIYHVRAEVYGRGNCDFGLIYDHETEKLHFIERSDIDIKESEGLQHATIEKLILSYDVVKFEGSPQEYIEFMKTR